MHTYQAHFFVSSCHLQKVLHYIHTTKSQNQPLQNTPSPSKSCAFFMKTQEPNKQQNPLPKENVWRATLSRKPWSVPSEETRGIWNYCCQSSFFHCFLFSLCVACCSTACWHKFDTLFASEARQAEWIIQTNAIITNYASALILWCL